MAPPTIVRCVGTHHVNALPSPLVSGLVIDGTNRAVLVAIAKHPDSGVEVTSVRIGTAEFTRLGMTYQYDTSGRLEVWGLADAPAGTVDVDWTHVLQAGGHCTIMAAVLNGVDGTTPFGTAATGWENEGTLQVLASVTAVVEDLVCAISTSYFCAYVAPPSPQVAAGTFYQADRITGQISSLVADSTSETLGATITSAYGGLGLVVVPVHGVDDAATPGATGSGAAAATGGAGTTASASAGGAGPASASGGSAVSGAPAASGDVVPQAVGGALATGTAISGGSGNASVLGGAAVPVAPIASGIGAAAAGAGAGALGTAAAVAGAAASAVGGGLEASGAAAAASGIGAAAASGGAIARGTPTTQGSGSADGAGAGVMGTGGVAGAFGAGAAAAGGLASAVGTPTTGGVGAVAATGGSSMPGASGAIASGAGSANASGGAEALAAAFASGTSAVGAFGGGALEYPGSTIEATVAEVVALLRLRLGTRATVDKWPQSPEMRLAHPIAGVWVGHGGSKYSDPIDLGGFVQERRVSLAIALQTRDLHGPHGIGDYLEVIRSVLQGRRLAVGGRPMAMGEEDFRAVQNGVWTYTVTVTFTMMSVAQAVPDPVWPPLTRVRLEDPTGDVSDIPRQS